MVNVTEQLVTSLTTILPTYYELFCDSSTTQPCITYRPYNNYSYVESDKTCYSKVSYYIKLWGKDYAVLNQKLLLVDAKMQTLGYKRTSYNELTADMQYCLICVYEGNGYETY